MVLAPVAEDEAYRNACRNSDKENAYMECNAAIQRVVLAADDTQLTRLYFDVTEFHNRLHQEVLDETYPRLHEYLRPITQDDIDDALRAWNGNMDSKRAVVRYMADHARDKDTVAWLCREYGGTQTPLFITRSDSNETVELSWPKIQRRIAQLIQEDKFHTDREHRDFEHIDPIAVQEAIDSPEAQSRADTMIEAAERMAADSAVETYERFHVVEVDRGFQYAYAVWDDLHDGYYVDDDGVTEEFDSEWQAEDYLNELRRTVAEKEAAEWLTVERAKVEQEPTAPELSGIEDESEREINEILDEYPTSVQINGEWRTFPNAEAAEEALSTADGLTALERQAIEITKGYETLPLSEKMVVIARTFGYTSGKIETSPCTGKWRGTSDVSIRFDSGASLFIGNERTPSAKTAKVQNELVNTALPRLESGRSGIMRSPRKRD